jgi:hypothetical protein
MLDASPCCRWSWLPRGGDGQIEKAGDEVERARVAPEANTVLMVQRNWAEFRRRVGLQIWERRMWGKAIPGGAVGAWADVVVEKTEDLLDMESSGWRPASVGDEEGAAVV